MHNNSQKRIYGDYLYSITSNVDGKINFFKNKLLARLWIEILKVAKIKNQFLLYAFCLNYDHFHLLIAPNNDVSNYSQIMQFLKRNTSQNINKILGYVPVKYSNSEYFMDFENDNSNCRLQSSQESKILKDDGSCYFLENDISQNLQSMISEQQSKNLNGLYPDAIKSLNMYVSLQRQNFIDKYGIDHKIPKFKWQKSFHDHIIRADADFDNHWNYIMHNFVKHGLTEDWEFTGLRFAEILDDWEL